MLSFLLKKGGAVLCMVLPLMMMACLMDSSSPEETLLQLYTKEYKKRCPQPINDKMKKLLKYNSSEFVKRNFPKKNASLVDIKKAFSKKLDKDFAIDCEIGWTIL